MTFVWLCVHVSQSLFSSLSQLSQCGERERVKIREFTLNNAAATQLPTLQCLHYVLRWSQWMDWCRYQIAMNCVDKIVFFLRCFKKNDKFSVNLKREKEATLILIYFFWLFSLLLIFSSLNLKSSSHICSRKKANKTAHHTMATFRHSLWTNNEKSRNGIYLKKRRKKTQFSVILRNWRKPVI